jgi:non-homologous end joining protein Ku
VTAAKHADLESYHNLYNERMEKLIQAKVAGKEIATAPDEEACAPALNFMEALKASLSKNKSRSPGSKKLGTREVKNASEAAEIWVNHSDQRLATAPGF